MKIITAYLSAILAVAAILAAPASAIGVTNDFHNRLMKMSPTLQRATMRRAVLDHEQYCRRIGPVAYQGPYKNLQMWVVKCDRGAAYGAFIGIDGSVQVRPCADLIEFKMPACRIPK
jgi:hypothetical protein